VNTAILIQILSVSIGTSLTLLINCIEFLRINGECWDKIVTIYGDRGKTMKFTEVGQTHEFCKSCDAHKEFTAFLVHIIITVLLLLSQV